MHHALGVVVGLAGGDADAPMEVSPLVPSSFAELDMTHPHVIDLIAQAEAARRAAELARIQTRAHPELTLSTTRERGTCTPMVRLGSMQIRPRPCAQRYHACTWASRVLHVVFASGLPDGER